MSLKSLVEKVPGYNSLVRPWHWLQAERAGRQYHWPAKNLHVIGVTGTNGKTTTAFMIWKMLNESGRKCGLLTTVAWGGVGDATVLHKQYEHMTTERVEVLNERMRAIAEAGAEYLVLETTSHALMQYRTLGVPIEIAVFTNITHEHLDYHKTFENYRKAKQKLFEQARYGVVNADDPNADWFISAIPSSGSKAGNSRDDILTYGIEQGEYRATDIKLTASGVSYSCGDMKVKTQIPGKFNVYNSLAAVCVGKKLGLSEREIVDGIAALDEVEGRMNRLREGQEFEVIVDYAHTPDALEKVFESLPFSRIASLTPAGAKAGSADAKEGAKKRGRVIAVHGGAGRRDESTREMRGEILGKYSDIVVVTEDDSRDEDPAKIAEQFMIGAEKFGKVREKDLYLELDRETAIRKALKMAKKGDIVLILGKGHEKTILRADGPHDFEDIKVARKVLRELKDGRK